jgi:hypothetical protein
MLRHALFVSALLGIITIVENVCASTTFAVVVAAETCLHRPDRPPTLGYYWSFRLDRTSKRYCWFEKKVPLEDFAYEAPAGENVSGDLPKPVEPQTLSSWFTGLVTAFEQRNPWIWEDVNRDRDNDLLEPGSDHKKSIKSSDPAR